MASGLHIVVCVGEGSDAVADVVGDGEGEGGDVVGTGGGEEDDGGESEALFEWAAAGFDVLDAGHGDAGTGDSPDATLEIDFEVADVIAPVAPADGRDDEDGDDPEDEGKDDREDAQVAWNVIGEHDQRNSNGDA